MENKFLNLVWYLRFATEFIAFVLCLLLIAASGIITWDAVVGLWSGDATIAIQNGLFVIILLEMFYVVRSFIKYGSVNVGIIAVVKELVFKIPLLNLQMALAFAVVLLSLGLVYLLETMHFNNKKEKALKA